MLKDFRFAVRQFLKTPGFTIISILTLSLAIGSCVAIFSAVDAVLLHPLPYPHPEQLVSIGENLTHFNLYKIPAAPPEYIDYKRLVKSFSAIGALDNSGAFTLTGSGRPEIIPGMHVTASMFSMLGVKPVAGSLFNEDAEKFGQHRVFVISEGLWKRRFGGDPSIIGRNLEIGGESYTVLGVIRPILKYRAAADIWAPLAFAPGTTDRKGFGRKYIDVIGRLKPGVSLEQARAEFRSIAATLQREYSDQIQPTWGYSLEVDPLTDSVGSNLKKPLLVLLVAVGAVMLIACANISNLLLARAMMRRREISIRTALGAPRGRVIRQLLLENLLLSLTGGITGIGLALYGLHLYANLGPTGLIRGQQPQLNLWVLGFSILLSVLASLIFGLAPALETSRINVHDALKESSRGSSGGRRLLRESMVAIEVAISLILLIGAGLLVRSFVRLQQADPGFRPRNVLAATIVLPVAQYKPPAINQFRTALLDRLRALPGVMGADAADLTPFSNSYSGTSFQIVGHDRDPNEPSPVIIPTRAGPDYFRVMGIPVRRGRAFTRGDVQGSMPVAIIDETVAKKYFVNMDPVGMEISSPEDKVNCRIVGIAGGIKYNDLSGPPQPVIYYPAAQFPAGALNVMIKTAGDPLATVSALRHEVGMLDPNLPLARIGTQEARVAESLARQRFSIQLMSVFAVIAALLAAIGIYGVLAFLIDQRRREIGIRIALGARAATVLGLVLRQGTGPVAIGLLAGIAGALGLTWYLKSLLYEVSVTDPLIFAGVSAGLVVVSLIAMAVPANRATRVNPVEALRQE